MVLDAGLVLPDADALVQAQHEADGVAHDEEEGDGQQDVGLARLLSLQLGGAGVAGLERVREEELFYRLSERRIFVAHDKQKKMFWISLTVLH